MTIDWDRLSQAGGEIGSEILDIIKPFLPALKREGPDIFDGFVKHLLNKEYDQIDRLMYERMTVAERRELEDEVLVGARSAAEAKFRQRELTKEILMKVAIRLVLGLL